MHVNNRITVVEHSSVEEYASVPIAFEVASVFDVNDSVGGDSAPQLVERLIELPYVKDYDEIGGNGPGEWASRFDLSQWQLFAAEVDGQRAGCAALVMNAPGVEMLEARNDLALLWDIRVAPVFRSRGVGSALLYAVEASARAGGARELKVETQNINVAACRFYESRGFKLRNASAGVYEGLPEEVQLLWYKSLDSSD